MFQGLDVERGRRDGTDGLPRNYHRGHLEHRYRLCRCENKVLDQVFSQVQWFVRTALNTRRTFAQA